MKRTRFNKSQVIFIKYLEQYDLHNFIKKLRLKLRIHEYGFTDTHQVLKWVDREGQEQAFNNQCIKFLAVHELPADFYDLLRDYVLTAFSFDIYSADPNKILLEVVESKSVNNQVPHYFLKVYEGATKEDIQRFVGESKNIIKTILDKQKRIELSQRLKTPSLHSRYLIIRDYKKFTKEDLLERFWVNQLEREELSKQNVSKNDLIKRLMKKRHGVTVSVENIQRI